MISSESVSHTESDQYVFHVCVWNVYADFFKETDSIPIARGRVYLSVTFFSGAVFNVTNRLEDMKQ